MTYGLFTQLEALSRTGDKEIFKIQMEHKVKTVKVLERHKIHPKAKAQMNIPLCHVISMPIVKLTFKIDVLKMEHVFQMGCQVFYVFPINW